MTSGEVELAYKAAKIQSRVYKTTEDDIQDFMLDLLRTWDRVEIKYSITNYLLKRASWFMLRRCEKNRKLAKRKVYELPDLVVQGDQEENLYKEEFEKALSLKLTGKQVRLFNLYRKGYSVEQVCDQVGYSVRTAHRKVRMAKDIVKELGYYGSE